MAHMVVVHCQYPLWIPDFQAIELKLHADFAEQGLDYDTLEEIPVAALMTTDDDKLDDSGEEDEEDGSDGTREFPAGMNSNEGHAPSERLADNEPAPELNEAQKKRKQVKELLKARAALFNAGVDVLDHDEL